MDPPGHERAPLEENTVQQLQQGQPRIKRIGCDVRADFIVSGSVAAPRRAVEIVGMVAPL
jgi:hypothetical protein